MTPFTICARIRNQLPSFVGQDLDESVAARVREHLRSCSRCRGEASGFLQARRALLQHAKAAALGVGDEQFAHWRERILDAVAASADADPRGPAGSSRAGMRPLVRWVAAASLLFSIGWLSASVGGFDSASSGRGFFVRSPIAATTDVRPASHMQPLGHESPVLPFGSIGSGGSFVGIQQDGMLESGSSGLMGRLLLRTLEDEMLPLDPFASSSLPAPPVRSARPRNPLPSGR